MNKHRLSIAVFPAVVLAVLACGINQGRAAQTPTDVPHQPAVKATGNSSLRALQKTAYQKRQEARKQLKDALEARKALRSAGKGATNE